MIPLIIKVQIMSEEDGGAVERFVASVIADDYQAVRVALEKGIRALHPSLQNIDDPEE